MVSTMHTLAARTSSSRCLPRLEVHSTIISSCVLACISADLGDLAVRQSSFLTCPVNKVSMDSFKGALSWQIMSASRHNVTWTPTSSALKVGSYWATWCLSMCTSTHCSKPFAQPDFIHIVKQQELVTYMSTVEVFATGPRVLIG